MPYQDPKVACEKILKSFKAIPFWPQLIRRSFFENMYAQFCENFPGVVVDPKEKRVYVDTARGFSKALETLYSKFLENDLEFFSISPQRAAGLYEMIAAVEKLSDKPKFLKGQTIGPVSFGLTVTDEKRRSIFYNAELKEALVKGLAMRARWQARKLKETGIDIVIFIDEPYLASMGSSYVGLRKEEALSALNEVIAAIHQEGAACGLHCCGNTDWGFLLGTGIDILNFDAYNFCESITLYPRELEAFLKRGGVLAWGIVPSTQDVLKENGDSLFGRIEKALGQFEKKGIGKKDILDSMTITPSCGLGLLEEHIAEIVINHTVEVSDMLKKAYGGGPHGK